VHCRTRDGDDLFFDGKGLLDGCGEVDGFIVHTGETGCHEFRGFSDPEHLLVFTEVTVAREGLLDDSTGHHAEFTALLGLGVHAGRDSFDVGAGRRGR
jgi:hypothetical protein